MKWTESHIPDQAGRTAVVTGANSGIGYETARALAAAGAHVVMACRAREKGDVAAQQIRDRNRNTSVEVMRLDLANLKSVRQFAESFKDNHDRLDLLINNAGVMMPSVRTSTADGFELQFGTNHLGHFALTGQLVPRLLATPVSRIVTVSSAAHRWGELDFDDLNWEKRPYKRSPSYGQSKLANLLFPFELHRRLEAIGSGTIALAAHPGWTRTNLQRDTPVFRAINPVLSMRPWQGALPTLFAATSGQAEGAGYYGPDGFFEMRGYPKRVSTSDSARSRKDSQRLWEESEELTGIRFNLDAARAA